MLAMVGDDSTSGDGDVHVEERPKRQAVTNFIAHWLLGSAAEAQVIGTYTLPSQVPNQIFRHSCASRVYLGPFTGPRHWIADAGSALEARQQTRRHRQGLTLSRSGVESGTKPWSRSRPRSTSMGWSARRDVKMTIGSTAIAIQSRQ